VIEPQLMIKLIGGGALVLGFTPAIIGLRRRRVQKTWIATPAKITESFVEKVADRSSSSTGTGMTTTTYTYWPRIKYEYEFEGKRHECGTIGYFSSGERSEELANEKLKNYALQTKVTAFVNPRHPSTAVLDQEVPLFGVIFFGGLALFIAGLAYIVHFFF